MILGPSASPRQTVSIWQDYIKAFALKLMNMDRAPEALGWPSVRVSL